jgi:phosphoribosylaminoimidazolecarboxamide formyltransferase/IMP cyclohydrolase
VVVNLYAFDATVAKGADFATCIENIDIGGPSMLRSSAKNHATVAVASSPAQYAPVLAALAAHAGATPLALRKTLACDAFTLTAAYDASISGWFQGQLAGGGAGAGAGAAALPPTTTRAYTPDTALKYGCNPHQAPAWRGHLAGCAAPFSILNGTPGYINFLDAANAWQLVSELRAATGLPAAASFKHCSPAGAAVAVPLTPEDCAAYDMEAGSAGALTPLSVAYLRARQADPMCSYGDFAAVSDVVDVATAEILKTEVSDGLVAPGYEPAALDILRKKKGGAFIILQAAPGYTPPALEFREVYGMVLAQRRNDAVITASGSMSKQVTAGEGFTEEVRGGGAAS